MWWIAVGVAVGVGVVVWRSVAGRGEVGVRGRVVVVTGCDSGIGLSLARHARRWGFTVVATVLQEQGAAADMLRREGVVVVMLDLRNHHTFTTLTTTLNNLHHDNQELWCLVNNAGVMTFGQCEWQTTVQVTAQVQVNLAGAIHLTSTLLPTLRRNKGRVVMVSSPTGQVGTANMTVYCATKAGIEGFTHALRRELAPSGMCVVLIRPCNLPDRTGIMRNAGVQLREMLENAAEETRQDFGAAMTEAGKALEQAFGGVEETQELRDDRLLHCFRCALLSTHPRLSYSAAPWPVTLALDLMQCLPSAWVDVLVAHGIYSWVLGFAKNK